MCLGVLKAFLRRVIVVTMRLKCALTPTKSCFVNLPSSVVESLRGHTEGASVLQLTWEIDDGSVRSVYVGWTGSTSSGVHKDCIEIPASFARSVQLTDALDSTPDLQVT